MALVTYVDQTNKEVRNLGWLLRNHDIVDAFVVDGGPIRDHGAHLRAWIRQDQDRYLKAPQRYDTIFQSRSILHSFLDRPNLRGLEVDWFGTLCLIGSPEYRALDPHVRTR